MRQGLLYDGLGDGQRLVVRRTFLSLVDDAEDAPMGGLRRSSTDSALLGADRGDVEYRPGSPSTVASTRVVSSDCEVSDTADGEAQRCDVQADVRPAAADQADPGEKPRRQKADARTTLMLRNLPNSYSRAMFLEMLDEEGFAGDYDFVYVPIDFSRGCGLGYAFVNLARPADVPRFRAHFDGFSGWKLRTSKVCQVTWSDRDQGLKANVRRYRNSPVMHESVPDGYKPVLFSDGARVPFPEPRGRLVRPSARRG